MDHASVPENTSDPSARWTSRPRLAGPRAHQSVDSVFTPDILDDIVCFTNSKYPPPDSSSRPEDRRLHPAGAMACPRWNRQPTNSVSTPGSASRPSTGGLAPSLGRVPAGSKPCRLRPAANHHQQLLGLRKPSAQLFESPRGSETTVGGDDPRVPQRRRVRRGARSPGPASPTRTHDWLLRLAGWPKAATESHQTRVDRTTIPLGSALLRSSNAMYTRQAVSSIV